MPKNQICESDQLVSGEIIRVLPKESKFGQTYFDVLFKMTETGSCFRSCIYTNCRNFSHWRDLLQVGNVFKNLELIEINHRIFVNADSVGVLIQRGNPQASSPGELKAKLRSLSGSIGKAKRQLQEELF